MRITQWLGRVAAAASVAIGVAACGGGGGASPVVAVYSSFGSVQCSGGGSTLTQLQQSLIAAGIEVLGSRCGLDGVVRPALCGAPDGRIAIFDIDEPAAAVALFLGFALLSTLPHATADDCT